MTTHNHQQSRAIHPGLFFLCPSSPVLLSISFFCHIIEITDSNTKIKGYSRDDAILLGVESRTSSPVQIKRDETGESNIKGIYPCGEGAGYAGGIMTAAMDGIKIAINILEKE